MNNDTSSDNTELSGFGKIFMILGVVFIASNLRAPLTCMGPVLDQISQEFSLSNSLAGLLTTIPLMCFAFLSAIVPKITRHYSMGSVLLVSLILLSIGLIIRPLSGWITLFVGAAIIGAAITVGNVLMPAYIKVNFPKKVGLMTGIYSVSMNLVAALAAGFSIYLGQVTHMGWRGSIGIWAVLGVTSVIIWVPTLKRANKVSRQSSIIQPEDNTKIYKSKLAWCVTIFMGLQSLLFYCIAAWLPKVTQGWGMSGVESGWVLSYVQFAQLPMTFLGAIIASKMTNQKPLAICVGLLMITGIGGILIWETTYIIVCCVLIGLGSGLAFSLCMILFVLRTRNAQQAAKLSAMAQAIGYSIAATGPPVFGGLFDWSGHWRYSFIFLLFASVILLITGYIASQDKYIDNKY